LLAPLTLCFFYSAAQIMNQTPIHEEETLMSRRKFLARDWGGRASLGGVGVHNSHDTEVCTLHPNFLKVF
jgi:hypothetical protein